MIKPPPYFQSDLLVSARVAHGFFTREGGVSQGLYAGLNAGLGSRDDKRDVRENRRRAAAALGFAADQLCTLHQIHSTTVLTATKSWVEPPIEADGLVTKTPGVLLGILTADCAPVLFADHEAGVVGAAHAGWRGALNGVLENTIDVMVGEGAKRERIVAAIGPCISQASYEVGADFAVNFYEKDERSRPFFMLGTKEGKAQFHLEGYVAHRLACAGLQQIEACGMDTFSNELQCFSYRRATLRNERDYGRQLSLIGISAMKEKL